MQPKIQKRIQDQQPKPKEPETELKEYQPEQILIHAFDQKMVEYLKTLQEQNNIYQGLRQQEEQLRVNLNNIKQAVHELKRMRPEELRGIFRPYLQGMKQITPADRNEFIKNNIMLYQNYDNQYKSVNLQRLHRGDELGEARMHVLKQLWNYMIYEHGIKPEELFEILKPFTENPVGVRKKEELPLLETVQ